MWWNDDPSLDEGHVRRLSHLEMLRRIAPRFAPHRGAFVLGIALMLVFVAAELLAPIVLRRVIDAEIPAARETGSMSGVVRAALLYLAIFLAGSLASFFQVVTVARMGLRIVAKLKSDLFEHVISLGASYFDHHPPGRLLARVESDTERLQMLFSDVALALLRSLILLAGTFAVMFATNVRITLGVVGIVVPFFLAALLFMRAMRPLYAKVRQRVAALSTLVAEHVQAVPILQVFGRRDWSLQKLQDRNMARYRVELGTEFLDYTFWGLFSTAEVLAVIFILHRGFGVQMTETMSLGTLVLFVEYTRRLFWPLSMVAEQLHFIQRAFASGDRVFQVLDTRRSVADRPGARSEVPADWKVIRFENVTFAYGGDGSGTPEAKSNGAASNGARRNGSGKDGRSVDAQGGSPGDGRVVPQPAAAVQKLSFTLRRGERIALVGASGAGKSTVTNLLLRFYEPTEGRVTIDGVDLRDYTQEAWRSRIGLVLQDIHLFPGSIADNLRVFDSSVDESQLRAAVTGIGAAPVLERRSHGLSTPLSEGGQNLSMGERQLVSFARAVVREPDLLLLDEATSSVDPATERRIQDSLQRMMQGRTALVVAHRLSTIVSADNILVMQHGRLVESGRHEELMKNPKGIYRALYDLQFAAGDVV